MTPEEIAEKYVHEHHDALTDNQEKIDMVADIEACIKAKLEKAAEKFNSLKITDKSQIFVDGYNEASFDMMQILESILNTPLDSLD